MLQIITIFKIKGVDKEQESDEIKEFQKYSHFG